MGKIPGRVSGATKRKRDYRKRKQTLDRAMEAKAKGQLGKEKMFLEGLAKLLVEGNVGRNIEGYTMLPEHKVAGNRTVEQNLGIKAQRKGEQFQRVLVKIKSEENPLVSLMSTLKDLDLEEEPEVEDVPAAAPEVKKSKAKKARK